MIVEGEPKEIQSEQRRSEAYRRRLKENRRRWRENRRRWKENRRRLLINRRRWEAYRRRCKENQRRSLINRRRIGSPNILFNFYIVKDPSSNTSYYGAIFLGRMGQVLDRSFKPPNVTVFVEQFWGWNWAKLLVCLFFWGAQGMRKSPLAASLLFAAP